MADDGSQQPKPDFRTAVEDGKALATVLVMKHESVLGRIMGLSREKASSRQPTGEKRWTHIVVILSFVMFVLAAFAIIVLGYLLQLKWTGVTGKTFWHWLGLIFAPVLLSGGGFLIYTLWTWSDHRNAQKESFEATRQAELHRISKGYLDDIEGLLDRLKANSEENVKSRALARARTLNVLQGLDRYRKGSIIRSLYAASLIKRKSSEQEPSQQPYIRLKGANLREAHLRWADLENACLSGVDFSYADLRDVKLSRADLSGADLGDTLLRRADLKNACLSGAKLTKADLSEADLSEADLRAANLTDALVTVDQLAQAKLARDTRHNIEGATMPDGQKYEDWLKDK